VKPVRDLFIRSSPRPNCRLSSVQSMAPGRARGGHLIRRPDALPSTNAGSTGSPHRRHTACMPIRSIRRPPASGIRILCRKVKAPAPCPELNTAGHGGRALCKAAALARRCPGFCYPRLPYNLPYQVPHVARALGEFLVVFFFSHPFRALL